MSPEVRRRRHSVVLRPKVRSLRLRKGVALGGLLLLAAAAVPTLRHLASQLPPWREGFGLLRRSAVGEAAVTGVEGARLSSAQALVAARPGLAPGRLEEALREGLPWARSVRVKRSWLSGPAEVRVEARRAVARVGTGGRGLSLLDAEGEVFSADADLYPGPLPVVEGVPDGPAEKAALARLVVALSTAEGPPAGFERLRRGAPGWAVEFGDGTRVLWGDLRWTAEKLARLREIVSDARARAEGAVSVDLRFFEDGRALLKALPKEGS